MKYVRIADLSITDRLDLTLIQDVNRFRLLDACRAVTNYGFNSLVIPSYVLEKVRLKFPKLRLTVISNYPYGFNDIEVVLKEITTITALVEDCSNLWIEFVLPPILPPLFKSFIVDFKRFNDWVKLIAVLPVGYEKEVLFKLDKCPVAFDYIGLGTGMQSNENIVSLYETYGKQIKKMGYKIKLNGNFNNYEEVKSLLNHGIELVGCVDAYKVIHEKVEA